MMTKARPTRAKVLRCCNEDVMKGTSRQHTKQWSTLARTYLLTLLLRWTIFSSVRRPYSCWDECSDTSEKVGLMLLWLLQDDVLDRRCCVTDIDQKEGCVLVGGEATRTANLVSFSTSSLSSLLDLTSMQSRVERRT
jgi:hypothetical protein